MISKEEKDEIINQITKPINRFMVLEEFFDMFPECRKDLYNLFYIIPSADLYSLPDDFFDKWKSFIVLRVFR